MQLPVTLLYDHQSVAEIVEYINTRITASEGDTSADGDEERGLTTASGRRGSQALAAEGPSNLLKVLRCVAMHLYLPNYRVLVPYLQLIITLCRLNRLDILDFCILI